MMASAAGSGRDVASLEAEVGGLARRIAELGADERTRVFQMSWISERMLDWAMSHPSFKTQLFRFVDVFPATTDDADVLRHLEEYFDTAEMPKVLDLGLGVAEHAPFGMGAAVSASVARKNIRRMAEQFIVGATPREAVEGLHRLWRLGSAATVDLLGEKTVTEGEADRYASRLSALLDALLAATPGWAPDDHLERDDIGPLPRANVSIKPTALASQYAPLTREEGLAQARARLLPILQRAADDGAFVWFDMEHYDVKDLTLELFRSLLSEPSLASLHAGVVVQAYLKDSYDDLSDLIAWSSRRPSMSPPIGVRLVKGAYWDAESITARAEGWPVPVFEQKTQTDANYERCVRLLHNSHGVVRAAFGSHNLRSLSYAVTYARSLGIPDTGYELQMLYGMAEPIHAAVRRLGFRLRVYAPVGELVPGMAYLVRRLLENTSNESFVRQRFAERRDVDALVAAPDAEVSLPPLPPPARRAPTSVSAGAASPEYEPEPVAEWRRSSVRAAFSAAVDAAPSSFPLDVPGVIGSERVATAATIESVDPACPSTCVAVSASCGPAEADDAVRVALRAWESWRRTPVAERAAVLVRAAEWMRARRDTLAALEVFEAGKPWKEADADVCEAIDFCEYYGREMLRLGAGGVVQSPPGESNALHYQAKGVGVVIAPWNFPLAIPTGMVTAALVTGNCVLFKPAEQTPAIASQLVAALEAGGLPPGVLSFLPGVGESLGAHLVTHPDVAFVAFTGSKAVGLSIVRAAAEASTHDGQRAVRRVIAEMGGKNAVVVDADADLDTAVPAIVQSAFGFAGQKCSAASRVVAVDAVYDPLVHRLAGAVQALPVGHPRRMSTVVGPLIDADASAKVRSYVSLVGSPSSPGEGRFVVSRADDVPSGGYFVGPCVVADAALDGRLATEEIFGPVLTVFRASTFADAVEVANATPYALTAGVVSRSPAHIRYAASELRAGNVYINRGITGAVVGRQPFGGYGMSGVGSKAGGPDYLLQFVDPRVVTENTLRQGFAPPPPSASLPPTPGVESLP